MSARRLSGVDTAFVYGESQRIPLHVGSLTIVEAAPLRDSLGILDIERLRSDVAARLHLIPQFRQRLIEVPFDQARPVWADDVRFRIEDHVHAIGLPRPGRRRQLLDIMARLQSVQMDRTRPLWEIWYVDGLKDESTVGVVTKIHHCMVDGTSGVELGTLLYDITPTGNRLEPPPWRPKPLPSRKQLLVDAMKDAARGAAQSARSIKNAVQDPVRPMQQVVNLLRALETATEEIDILPFNARVSSRRCFDTVRIPFEKVHKTRQALRVKVNDVVLAAVTGALRAYCENRRLNPASLERIRALVPVDRRQPGDTEMGTKVSSMFVELPVAERSLRKRLELLAEQTRLLKDSKVADGTETWNRLTEILPPAMLRVTSRLQFRDLMRTCNLLVSNIRGPDVPLYSSGGKVLEMYPYFGIQDNLGLTIVILSYAGQVHVGITTDPELMPDVAVLVAGIGDAFDELYDLALRRAKSEKQPNASQTQPPPGARGQGGR